MESDQNTAYATRDYLHQVDWRQTATYALGIGATRQELAYLYEAMGPKVYPTFAVVPAFPAVVDVVSQAGGGFDNLVHAGQRVVIHAPIPAEGVLRTVGRLEGKYDLKRMAQVVASTQTWKDEQLVAETTWTLLLFDRGGFGGPRPPKTTKVETPAGQDPDFVALEHTSPEQSLLYRLSGDTNPLHVDAEFAKKLGFPQGPILHGLCTFGFLARAVIRNLCEGQGERLRSIEAQFKRPVWPGETLVSQGWRIGEGRVALSLEVKERDEKVLGNAWAEIEQGR